MSEVILRRKICIDSCSVVYSTARARLQFFKSIAPPLAYFLAMDQTTRRIASDLNSASAAISMVIVRVIEGPRRAGCVIDEGKHQGTA